MSTDKDPIDWPVLVGLLLVAMAVGWLLGWWLGADVVGGGK